MTVLLPNRSISIILMVPDVDAPTSDPNIEQIDQSDSNPSMPVYHGSIIHVEPHSNDRNTSDLIIRIPNFQRLPLPTNDTDTQKQTSIKRRAPICPVLANSNPIEQINRENSHHVKQSRIIHTNRLTTGLRSLSRAFTHNCRSKRTASVTEITFPRALPDVEVINEKSQLSISPKKHPKDTAFSTPIPKMTPPNIFLIKRKDLQTKKRQVSSSSSSSSSSDIQHDLKHKRPDQISTSTILTTQYTEVSKSNSPKITSFLQGLNEQDNLTQIKNISEIDEHHEMDSTSLTYEVEQQIKAICQLVSDQPVSSIDADSLSTHRYSSISAINPENSSRDELSADILPTTVDEKVPPKPYRPFHIQTSILQPDISVVRIGTSNLTTEIGRVLPGEIGFDNRQKIVEEDHSNVIDSNDEILAECYEVTYQLDENNQIINQSTIPIQISLDPSEYRQLISRLSETTPNQYEQIEQQNTIPKDQKSDTKEEVYEHLSKNISTNNTKPTDQSELISDSSRHCTLQHSDMYDGFGVYISTDIETQHEHLIQQVEELSPGYQAGLQDNDRILCINGTSVIDEDYTVVLQLIKYGLDTDTLDFHVMSNNAYEEFQSQMNSMS